MRECKTPQRGGNRRGARPYRRSVRLTAGLEITFGRDHEQRVAVGNFIGTSAFSVVHVDGYGTSTLNLDVRSQANMDGDFYAATSRACEKHTR